MIIILKCLTTVAKSHKTSRRHSKPNIQVPSKMYKHIECSGTVEKV